MYRFLLTPRWLAGAALAVAAAVVMVLLGNWQLYRYHERSAINDRIDAADTVTPVALTSILAAPTRPSAAGAAPGKDLAWTRITVTGSYDPAHEIQARGRTVNGDVGYEIVTPLRLADGSAVLIDRGWVPPGAGGSAIAPPQVPPAPTGPVTVVGQIHLSESRPTSIEHRDGRLDTRRISVPRIAHELPFAVYGAYVLLTAQTPAADPAFSAVPIDHEDSWQNGGYAVQWWLFAGMALFAFGFQARKEARGENGPAKREKVPREPAPADRGRAAPADRVSQADRQRAARPAPIDRVEEADRKRAARPAPVDRVEEADRRRAAQKAVDQA